jgi:hypothetical protein
LCSFVLTVVTATSGAMAPAVAGDARTGRVMKPSYTMNKSRRVAPVVKNTTIRSDYYTTAREMQMKISM